MDSLKDLENQKEELEDRLKKYLKTHLKLVQLLFVKPASGFHVPSS